MTIHLQGDVPGLPACGAATGDTVPLDEALTDGGRHFDCVDCHKLLTDGQQHSTPEEQR